MNKFHEEEQLDTSSKQNNSSKAESPLATDSLGDVNVVINTYNSVSYSFYLFYTNNKKLT